MNPARGKLLAALRRQMASDPLVQALNDLAKTQGVPVYLVGGYLRDVALGRPLGEGGTRDVDCAVPEAKAAARAFAGRATGGRLVRLDAANWRVIPEPAGRGLPPAGWVDFSDLRGGGILADLRGRDFTLNALACRLPDPDDLLDPAGGLEDLAARRIRAVSDRVFREDPLRLLRAYRLAAQLDFSIDPSTLSRLRRDAARLEGEPGERVRAELFGTLAAPRGGLTLRGMRDSGVLHVLFPPCRRMDGLQQGGHHHTDVLTHSLDTVEALEDLLKDFPPDPAGEDPLGRSARDYLAPPHRLPVLKLAALLHDAGKPDTQAPSAEPPAEEKAFTFHGHEKVGAEAALAVAGRLRLSRCERESLVRLVRLHMRPGFLFRESGGDPKAVSGRALHRLARDAEEDLPGLALLAIADAHAHRGPLAAPGGGGLRSVTSRVVEFARGVLAEIEARVLPGLRGPRWVTGRDLMEALGIPEGPQVGRLLLALEEARAAGEIQTRAEALALARKILSVDPAESR